MRNFLKLAGVGPAHSPWILVAIAMASTACRQESQRFLHEPRVAVPDSPERRGIPLAPFERNDGQADSSVAFLRRSPGHTLFLRPTDATLVIPAPSESGRGNAVRMRLVGADPFAQALAVDALPGHSNYLIGPDPQRWRTNVPHSRRAAFEEVLMGIRVEYYATTDGALEFDFVVSPGADPSAIELAFDGATAHLGDDGSLRLDTDAGSVVLKAPLTYQEVAGARQVVASSFLANANGTFGIDVASYDPALQLVIDPVLEYAAFVGGSGFGFDVALDMTLDSNGRPHLAGSTLSPDFPVTAGALDAAFSGTTEGFVTRLSADGTSIEYSTFIGGSNQDEIQSISLDSAGAVYVAGRTLSFDFPTTLGAADTTFAGSSDGFVAKLLPDGTGLSFSSFLGGSEDDLPRGVAVDGEGRAWLTGETKSDDFALVNPIQSSPPEFGSNVFVTRFATDGTEIEFSTFLGAFSGDGGDAIAIGPDGAAFVTGRTTSNSFPTTEGAFQRSLKASTDCFVTKISPAGSLLYSTLLGGTKEDYCYDLALGPGGEAVVTGTTLSKDFPTAAAYQPAPVTSADMHDVFVTKLSPSGDSLVFSTYLSGSSVEQASGIAISALGDVVVTGITTSTDFPSSESLQPPPIGDADLFLTKLTPAGGLAYSTFLGNSEQNDQGFAAAIDDSGAAWVAGYSAPAGSNDIDAFVAKVLPLSAKPDSYSTVEDMTLEVATPGVLGNDEGVESALLVTAPAHAATFSLAADGSFLYLPATNFSGTDTFSYRASAGSVETATATVTITVLPVNDVPEAVSDAFSGFEDEPLSVAAPGVLENDADPDGDALSSVLVVPPTHGAVTLSSDGSLVYLPEPDFSGPDSFSYAADDGAAFSEPAVVSVIIAPLNDHPSASDDAYELTEDASLTVSAPGVLGNDLDMEGDALTASLVSGPTNGTLSFDASGAFSYTPDPDFFGTDSFRYAAGDATSERDPATVTLTIAPVNDAVVPQSDSFAAAEDSSLSVDPPGVLGNDTDPDGDALAAMLVSPPSSGTISLAADGSFVYTPDLNFFGTDTFTYTVGDGATLSEPITVTLAVAAGAPDPPVTQSDSYTIEEDGVLSVPAEAGVLANDSDPEQTGLTATLIDPPAEGSLSFAASGAFTYEPPPDFHGSTSFTYTAQNDPFSSAPVTVTLSVTPEDDTPVAVNDSTTTDQSISTTIPVVANDIGFGDKPISLMASAPANGTTVVNADLTITYKPALHFAGQDGFSYTVTDVDGQSSSAWVAITVNPAQLVGSSYYGVSADDVIAYLPHDDFGNTACFDFENNDFVEGATSASAFVSCGSLESGPVAEISINLDKTWRVDARVAASQGNSEHEAGTYSLGYAQDTYTVLQGTSQLPADAQVPLFLRLHRKLDIQNAPYISLTIHPQIKRLIGDGQATNFYNTGTTISNDLLEDKFMDIPLPSVAFGTRFRALWILTAIAESGGAADSLIDPKIIDASVEFSLCSSAPGVQVIGASGTDGDCGGDIHVAEGPEVVQAVFGASTLVAGKDGVIAIDLGNDFDRPMETSVRFEIERSGLPFEEFTDVVTIPANCASKRYYFPNPDPDPASAGSCAVHSQAAGSLAPPPPRIGRISPVSGTDWKVIVKASPVDTLIETDATNNTRPTILYPVKETDLFVVYTRIECASCPYGPFRPGEYHAAIAVANSHNLALLPVADAAVTGGFGYRGQMAVTPSGESVVVGDPRSCGTPNVASTCLGIEADVRDALQTAIDFDAALDRVIAMRPNGYMQFHQYTDASYYWPIAGVDEVVLLNAEAVAGTNPAVHTGIHFPHSPHELMHSLGLGHVGPNPNERPPAPVSGYWVGCPPPLTDCLTPADADDVIGPSRANSFYWEAPRRWISLRDYDLVRAQLAVGPDPAVLALDGVITKTGILTMNGMREYPNGKASRIVTPGNEGDLSIDVLDANGGVLHSTGPLKMVFKVHGDAWGPEGLHVVEDEIDHLMVLLRIPYPPETATIRFTLRGSVLLELDPLSMTLRTAIESIPSEGYSKNAEQRKKALLNKVDAFEKILSEDKPGAREKLRDDIRKAVEDWVTEYAATPLQFSKAKLLALIDRIVARLEARLPPTETPTSTPQP